MVVYKVDVFWANLNLIVTFISFVKIALRPRSYIRVSLLLYLFYSCLLVASKKCHIFAHRNDF